MARFRAWASDDEESNDEEVEEIMQVEAEPAAKKSDGRSRRRGGTVDSDMDEDADDAEEAESRSSSASPPPPTNRPVDPTLTPWAREVGVDRQKMHVMQTALFRVPEEEEALKAVSEPPVTRKQLLTVPPELRRKHSRDSDGEGARADSRPVSNVA